MERLRIIGLGLVGTALGLLAACESSDDGGTGGAAEFCPSLEGYVGPCDEPNICDQALARDCGPLQAILQPDIAAEVARCMQNLGAPMDCFDRAADLSTSSALVEDFATAFCLECGDGSGTCEAEVLSGEDDTMLGQAGRLARALTREALEEVQDQCTTGESCADGFEACAKQMLARELPSETASCMVDAVYDDYADACDVAVGSTTGDTDSAEGGPSSDSFPTDTDDPTGGTQGDTDGTCDAVGCACQFNEECAGGLICPEGTCVQAMVCGDDPNEPNDDEMAVTFLDPITDSDGQGSTIGGELDSPTDIDWFRYEGEDTAFAIVGPFVQVNINALELCMYAECLNGLENTDVSCNEGTTQQPSPTGRPGCCGVNTGGFELNLSCGGAISDDSALVYMSVSGSEAGVCQEYTVTYHY